MTAFPAAPDLPTLELGYSLCPNDTFIFHALHAGLTPSPVPVREVRPTFKALPFL